MSRIPSVPLRAQVPVLVRAVAAPIALGLVLAACGSSTSDTKTSGTSGKGGTHTLALTITDEGCEPAKVTTPAGPTTFEVKSTGSGAVTEVEILKGTSIIGEVENVAPGLDGLVQPDPEARHVRHQLPRWQRRREGHARRHRFGGQDRQCHRRRAERGLDLSELPRGSDRQARRRHHAVRRRGRRPATWTRPRRCTPRPGPTTRRSSRWPRASATSIPRSTPATAIRCPTVRRGAASTASRRRCGRTARPMAWRRWPRSC